jgi:CRISPR-associated protein Csd1
VTVLQALDRYYDRMAARREVALPGYSWEPVGIVLMLSHAGDLLDVQIRRDPSGKKPKAELVPKWFGRSGNGSTPYFLWDNTAYALGVSSKDPAKTARDHAAFQALHLGELRAETDQGLVAFRHFLERWTPGEFKAPFFDERMLAWNVAFRLEGEEQLIHQSQAAAAHVERLRTAKPSADAVFCLITGRMAAPVRLHPKIKGVDGTSSAEVPLVSFNEDAFASYGKTQGFNAPTSEEAAFRYGAALNRLLDRGLSSNRIRVAEATVAFWADASGVGEEAARAVEDLFTGWFSPSLAEVDADKLGRDASDAAKLRDALRDVAAGRPMKDVNPRLAPGVRFHVLGLSPNAARLSVRYWLDDRFEVFAKRLADHYADLAIIPAPWGASLPAVQRLLVKTTAVQEKFDNIPPLLAGEVTRAILTGAPYPHTLLAAALIRLRAGDDPGTGWHAAAIRAVLAREKRLKHLSEETPVSLDRENPNPAYQLGRMFAALETAQRMALGRNVNATIRDRYFGAASATPASVFPLLLRGVQNHLGKLRKEGKGGWIEKEIEDITNHLPPELPRALRLEAQGRFAIGYYHQRKAQFAVRRPEEIQAEEAEVEGNVDDE